MQRNLTWCMIIGSVLLVMSLTPLWLLTNDVPVQTFTVLTDDDVQIQYEVIKKTDTLENSPLAVLLHGFSGNRIMMRMIGQALASQGLICASVDLRGHGSSEGIMESTNKFNQDMQAVIQSLETQGFGDTNRIVFIGHSMGGGVILAPHEYSASSIATIGIAPVASPEWVTPTIPSNLLLVIATGDSIINATTVQQTFYQAANGTQSFNTLHTTTGTGRELFVVEGSDHLNILYEETAIREIVKWVTRSVFGTEQDLTISPLIIQVAVYLSFVGGMIVIVAGLVLVNWRIRQNAPIEAQGDKSASNLMELAKMVLLTIMVSSVIGPLITGAVGVLLLEVTPLVFTNFIAALFLGNAISFAVVAWLTLRHRYSAGSYGQFVRTSLKASSLWVDLGLGVVGALAVLTLFTFTFGTHLTATFTTASARIIVLPLFIMSFVAVFFFFESLFVGVTRPLMGSGGKQVVYSILFEVGLLFGTFLLEMFIISTILSFIMPIIRLEFFVLGLNLLLLPLITSRVSAVILHMTTRGWLAQIIISASLFASLTIVFSPILLFF